MQHEASIALLHGDEGDIYMGGWTEDGRRITATSLRDGQPFPIMIDVASGTAVPIDIPLPGAWAGQLRSGRMLIESNEAGDPEIYVFNTDSGTVTRLTFSSANEWHPNWDADGERVVIDSDREGQLDLYMLSLDSGVVQRLTDDERPEQVGRLSPDGADLAFHRFHGPGELDYDIYVKSLEDGTERRLTDAAGDDSYPDWSPDGGLIAFSSNRNGHYSIYLMCADGTEVMRVTDGEGDARYPRWSPDGLTIAFQSDSDGRHALFLLQNMRRPDCPVVR